MGNDPQTTVFLMHPEIRFLWPELWEAKIALSWVWVKLKPPGIGLQVLVLGSLLGLPYFGPAAIGRGKSLLVTCFLGSVLIRRGL